MRETVCEGITYSPSAQLRLGGGEGLVLFSFVEFEDIVGLLTGRYPVQLRRSPSNFNIPETPQCHIYHRHHIP